MSADYTRKDCCFALNAKSDNRINAGYRINRINATEVSLLTAFHYY